MMMTFLELLYGRILFVLDLKFLAMSFLCDCSFFQLDRVLGLIYSDFVIDLKCFGNPCLLKRYLYLMELLA